jgi:hypothetical protein
MFRATMCPSSGEITVSMRHLVFFTLYGWLSQVSHRYSYFSWWWAHSCSKHVEKRNKHIKKNCAPSWLYLQDYTRMHGQQNIKFCGWTVLPEGSFNSDISIASCLAEFCYVHIEQVIPVHFKASLSICIFCFEPRITSAVVSTLNSFSSGSLRIDIKETWLFLYLILKPWDSTKRRSIFQQRVIELFMNQN